MKRSEADHHLAGEPEEKLRAQMIHRVRLMAGAIRTNGWGGIVSVLREKDDPDVPLLLREMKAGLGVRAEQVRQVNLEAVVTALAYGVRTYRLGIDDEALARQSLPQTLFQLVYQGFGGEQKGWRIGRSAMIDELKELLRTGYDTLAGTPFAEFIGTLSLNELREPPSLVVVDFPPLDSGNPIVHHAQADSRSLTPEKLRIRDTYLHTYQLITQVYPGRFQEDNPAGSVVVCLIDQSHRWLAARDHGLRWQLAYEFMNMNGMETPAAVARDVALFRTLNEQWD